MHRCLSRATTWTALVVAAICLGAFPPSRAHADTVAPIALPDGVADPSAKTGYLKSPNGGLDALDLATGKVLWHSAQAARPLVVAGNKLLALKPGANPNELLVLLLDLTQQGKKLREIGPVTFPSWVVATDQPTHGRSYQDAAWVENGVLVLNWEARAWYAGGARPPPEMEEAARHNATGQVRINLEKGTIQMREAGAGEPPKPAEPQGPRRFEEIRAETGARTLRALDRATGTLLWQHKLAPAIELLPLP